MQGTAKTIAAHDTRRSMYVRSSYLKKYECQSWESVKRVVNQVVGDDEFFWRGQGNASWQLCSSLYRFYEGHDVAAANRWGLERSAIQEFRASHMRVANQFSDGESISTTDIMVRMQHFGCPTRLLDWTWSPYIAAYFSLTDIRPTGGAVYGLNITEYQAMIGPKLPLDDYDHGILRCLPDRILGRFLDSKIRFPIPISPTAYTGREFQQQSTFLLDLVIESTTEEVLEDLAPDYLHKIKLSPDMVVNALDDLAKMNIDGFHLFEGVEGCAKKARDRLLGLRVPGRSIKTIEIDT